MFLIDPFWGASGPANTLDPSFYDGFDNGTPPTFSNGNLTFDNVSGNDYATAWSLIGKSSGKWYAELNIDTTPGGNGIRFGIVDSSGRSTSRTTLGTSSPGASWCYNPAPGFGQTTNNSSSTAGFATGTGVIGVAVDVGAGKIWWSLNNTYIGSGNPAAGTGEQYSNVSGTVYIAFNTYIGAKGTVHLGAGHTYSPPSGFSVWA